MGTSLYRTALLIASALLAPGAIADIYTWTDERGTTVISDTPPANPKRVSDLQVVARDDRKSAKRSGAREATPTEQKLLDRIDDLERQVRAQSQAQTYSSPPAVAPAPQAAVTYYTTPPAPPAYDPYYQSGYYYPAYSYGWPAAVVVGSSFFGHRHHGHFGHRHHGHFGQRAAVTGRGPVVARGRR